MPTIEERILQKILETDALLLLSFLEQHPGSLRQNDYLDIRSSGSWFFARVIDIESNGLRAEFDYQQRTHRTKAGFREKVD